MSLNNHTTLIVGAGYVGAQLANRLEREHKPYVALVASLNSLMRLKDLHVKQLDLDHEDPINIGSLFDASSFQIVYLVPPSVHYTSDVRLTRLLKCLPTAPARFIYVSTSGVYGDRKGAVTTEETPLSPKTSRAKLRVSAEQNVLTYCSSRKIPSVILRVPGIYGPDRLPLEALRANRGFIQLSEAFPGNRIHRDDLVNCLLAACDSKADGIYNVGDGNYMSSTEFAMEVSKLAGLDLPKQISRADMKTAASMRRWSFLSESRRLDNRKLRGLLDELEMPMKYSDPLEGIKHSLS